MGLFNRFRSIFDPDAASATVEAKKPSERRATPRSNPREGTRVLVIDDSHTVIVILKRFLESAGCVVLEALDAKVGLQLALTQKPELVFLDIVMPGINGFAALRALRKNANTKHIPVIMMSGNEQATAQFFGINIGADDFMKKPFSRAEVFARIEKLLDEEGVPHRPPDAEIDATPPASVVQPAAATPAAPSPLQVAQTPAAAPVPVQEAVVHVKLPTLSPPHAFADTPAPPPEPFPREVEPMFPHLDLSPPSAAEPQPPQPPQRPIAPQPATPVTVNLDIPRGPNGKPMSQSELLTQIIKWATLSLSDPKAVHKLAPFMASLLEISGHAVRSAPAAAPAPVAPVAAQEAAAPAAAPSPFVPPSVRRGTSYAENITEPISLV